MGLMDFILMPVNLLRAMFEVMYGLLVLTYKLLRLYWIITYAIVVGSKRIIVNRDFSPETNPLIKRGGQAIFAYLVFVVFLYLLWYSLRFISLFMPST